MSATAVQVPTHTTVNEREWVKLFPKEVTENYTTSITFIKKMTEMAIGTITYLKNAFPEESYYTETFAGLKLKILKDKCGDDLAQFVSTSLKQAFDAFDKKYVHQLALCFYSGDCKAENLIEYHIFEYSFNSEGVTLNINSQNRNNNAKNSLKCSMESVKTRTMMFVRALSLFVYQNCQEELPVNYDVSLRLYYNEASPEDYQAPGFGACSGRDHLEGTADALCLGWVETPYHKLIARAFVRELNADSDAAVPSDNEPEITQPDNDEFQASNGQLTEPHSDSSLEPALRCPCGKQDAAGQALVTCQYCHTQQHSVCFGLVAPVAEHCCAVCAEAAPGRASSCALLPGLELRKQECLCIFRRTLAMCALRASITGEELQAKFKLSSTSTSKMIRLLQSHYILPSADSKDLKIPRSINPLRLKLTSKKFFQIDAHHNNMADRMMAETEKMSDPIGEVLNPMEKITLISNLGTVIEPVSAELEYPSSQELRELELPSKDNISEELPLSGSHNPVNKVGKTLKRKPNDDDDEDWTPKKLPKLRSGAKSKKKM